MRAGTIAFGILFVLAYMGLKGAFEGLALGGVMLVLCMTFISMFGEKVYKRDRGLGFGERVRRALQVLRAGGMLAGDDICGPSPKPGVARHSLDDVAPLVVFLRTFLADAFEVKNPDLNHPASKWIPLLKYSVRSKASLDDGIRFGIPEGCSFVAISSATSRIGAVPIQRTDQDWKIAVDELCARAQAVIVVPGLRQGTEWEVRRLILLGVLPKCLFMFLPVPPRDRLEASSTFEFSAVKQMLKGCGLSVPDTSPAGNPIRAGDVVVFSNRGSVLVHAQEVLSPRTDHLAIRVERLRKCFRLMDRNPFPRLGNEAKAMVEEARRQYDLEVTRRELAERRQREEAEAEAEAKNALKPKGRCPNCSALIPLDSETCSGCLAVFGPGSAWQVRNLQDP